MNIKEGELKGIKMLGEPVRLYVNGTINLGIRCQELMKHEAEKILQLSEKFQPEADEPSAQAVHN